jgi:cytochrome c peroxidase
MLRAPRSPPWTALVIARGLALGCVLVLVAACDPAGPTGDAGPSGPLDLPLTPFNYAAPELPRHFENTGLSIDGRGESAVVRDRSPEENPVTDEGATLGRVLFYDTLLSRNETISCASCHRAEVGFSDDAVLSEGFDGGETGRHSMGLSNARFTGNGRYFWDERAETLEDQVLMPIQDDVEMGMTLEEVITRVEAAEHYGPLFERAFGDGEVTEERLSFALAQFVRSIVSFTAPYDEGRAQVSEALDPFPNFSDEENEGKRLFLSTRANGGFNCVACHLGEAFVAPIATSNGLDLETTDPGVGETTGRAGDEGKFRVPSLRNVAVRAPYMHDGRFEHLNEVLDHYSRGVKSHPALTVYRNADGSAMVLDFTNDEQAALLAFMETLTDEAMLADPKFQDPFR